MTQPLPLIAENVSCKYGDTLIVNAATLTLEAGKITALLGQSGAGKSTLLRLFSGLEAPHQGRILHGETLLSDGGIIVPAERRRIGIVFQDFALFPNLTAAQNIAFGLSHLSDTERQAHTTSWLERIALTARADAYPHQMSGGEQQRVAIARALAPKPVALLMDEPFSGLDPALRDDVRQTALKAIGELEIPALLVTHDADEAMLFADHLAVMRAGRIVQQGPPDDIYTSPIDEATASALGPVIKLAGTWNAKSGKIDTEFGPLDHPEPAGGPTVTVLARPEAFVPDPTSQIHADILSVRHKGSQTQLVVTHNETEATILVPASNDIYSSKHISLRLNPRLCVVF